MRLTESDLISAKISFFAAEKKFFFDQKETVKIFYIVG